MMATGTPAHAPPAMLAIAIAAKPTIDRTRKRNASASLLRGFRTLPPLPAIHTAFLPAITRRHAASSVAPISRSDIGAPCVLAWLGASDPEHQRHYWKGRALNDVDRRVDHD